MRVLVFEQWRGGHYFNYLTHLIPRLSELAGDVVVAMTERAASDFEPTLRARGAFQNVRFDTSVPEAAPALPARERSKVLGNLRDAVARHAPDYLLVPSADAQTLALGALGHLRIPVLPAHLTSEATFHQGYGPAIAKPKHVLKELAYTLAYSGCTWTRLNFVSFLYYEHAVKRGAGFARRARLVPDPVPNAPRLSRLEARRLLGIPEEGRYVGLLGSLDVRKAVPELLAAFRAARLGATDRLLLAGRLDPDFRALIDRDYADLVRAERVVVLDRFLSDDELVQGYGALDLVSTVYRDFPGLASLLLKGLAAGRPVLAHDFGWSRAVIKRFDVGATCDIESTPRFADSLRSALDASEHYVESEAVKRLLAFHAESNFTETMLEGVRHAAGNRDDVQRKTWDWVLEALDPSRRALI